MARSILDYFPTHLSEPRQAQRDILLALEAKWDRYDVFIISAPVAAGKSAIAYTLVGWTKQATVLTPNNILRDQYAEEYPQFHTIRKRAEYWCTSILDTVDIRFKRHDSYCLRDCEGCKGFLVDRQNIELHPKILANYYGYIAYKKWGSVKPTLIIDEAHNLTNTLREFAGTKIWHHEVNYPLAAKTRLDLMAWAETLTPLDFQNHPNLEVFAREIRSSRPKYVFKLTKQYHGQKSVDQFDKLPLIKMTPVDIRGLDLGSRLLWPYPGVGKLVLMSATISKLDIEQFGLQNKRVCYLECASPIDPERRPVYIPNTSKNMGFKHQQENIPPFIKFLQGLADMYLEQKGMIHVPYNLASQLRPYLESDPRYIFHTRTNKMVQYLSFRSSEEPKILVASGMNEGIDLPGDLCRWQVIAKVPYPSLADPALRWMAMKDGTWYAWQSIRDLIQASGRICRTPDDFGETYIYDDCFRRLYEQNPKLFPEWFKNAVIYEEPDDV